MTTSTDSILARSNPILWAVWNNVLSWFVQTFVPSWQSRLIPVCPHEILPSEQTTTSNKDDVHDDDNTQCILIGRPGGMEQLRVLTLKPGTVTCGYNLGDYGRANGLGGPFVTDVNAMLEASKGEEVLFVIKVHAFSVNYADCCIRWGLYKSANQYVGYPICPGFDIAGVVERIIGPKKSWLSSSSSSAATAAAAVPFKVGDRVYGCSLFGAYSTRVLVPGVQLRKIPTSLSMEQAASLPAVTMTALYALFLAGQYFPNVNEQTPQHLGSTNRAILIHSAAGGVGSMLVQISKILGMSPIVGVVGLTAKVDVTKALGCDVVIDKSSCATPQDMWEQIQAASPSGYSTVMESNGVVTLQKSYDVLCPMGRIITYGFHTNLPMGQDMLSPWEWVQMARKMWFQMPTFNVMEMGTQNKSIMAFNLSFFAQEREILSKLFDQLCTWIEKGQLHCPRVTTFEGLDRIAEAHELIQSGNSVGKLIITTTTKREANEPPAIETNETNKKDVERWTNTSM